MRSWRSWPFWRFWRLSHVIICVIGGVLGAVALYVGLPASSYESVSWNPPGGSTLSLAAMATAFLLPIAALTTDVLLRSLIARHPIETPESAHLLSICDAIMLRAVTFLMGVHAVVLAGSLGMLAGHAWAARLVPMMLGLTMMGVGNLLPRTRQNLAIGIRTSHTLSDRAVWMQTHRLVGRLIVIGGLTVVVAAAVLPAPIGTGFVLAVGPVILVGSALAAAHASRRASATTAY